MGDSQGLTFRTNVTEVDINAIKKIVQETKVFNKEEMDLAEELLIEGLKQGEEGYYKFLLAEDKNNIKGYICYAKIMGTEGTYEIYWIAVNIESQGTGIGKALMEEAEKKIKLEGGRRVFLATSSRIDYTKAHRLYEKHGFKRVAVLENYYDNGNHQLIYGKSL
jgi:ribosomal protein S18 acetylase RimI-like enzyme